MRYKDGRAIISAILLAFAASASGIAGTTREVERVSVAGTVALASTRHVPTATPGRLQPAKPAAPYDALPLPEDPTEIYPSILGAMRDRTSHVWLEGDVLHMAHVSKEGPVQITGGIQRPLERVPGTDVWLARLRKQDGWNRAYASYLFMGSAPPIGVKFEVWRGPDAPPEPPQADSVACSEMFETQSASLGEKRMVTVVLPPGVTPQNAKDLPALVLADGQSAENWGMIVRALIESGAMRPIAIVGIHSAGYRGNQADPYDPELDFRAKDYVESLDPERFAKHLKWVSDELLPDVARRFGISTRREDLAVGGFSNGGAFAVAAGVRASDRFGAVLGLSVGIAPDGERPTGELPRFFLAAGVLEEGFHRATSAFHDKVRAWGGESRFTSHQAGHDDLMWRIAAAEYLPVIFPPIK